MPHTATRPGLSADAIARQLAHRFGTTPARARELAERIAQTSDRNPQLRDSLAQAMPQLVACATPIRYAVPWSLVVSDNRRASITRGRSRWRAYRDARAALHAHAQNAITTPALMGPLALIARAYFPNARRRDVGNLRKAITDALNEVAYQDDSQLVAELWARCGVDRANARVEITIIRPDELAAELFTLQVSLPSSPADPCP